jgi:hypothetical protein
MTTLIGTSVFVLVAVVGLGVIRTSVVYIEDPVAVVVRIWATIFVLKSVEVLGIVRA